MSLFLKVSSVEYLGQLEKFFKSIGHISQSIDFCPHARHVICNRFTLAVISHNKFKKKSEQIFQKNVSSINRK